jgi:1-deoxy-D-xylulose-5-phosphate reductoisomerase
MLKRLSILGSTGSIGRSALDVVEDYPDRFQVVALAAGGNVTRLAEQAERHRPALISVAGEAAAAKLRQALPSGFSTEIVTGRAGAEAAASLAEADLVVSGIVGAAGLPPTYAAVGAGKTVALANKETLVMAGELIMGLARRKKARILPVDSEHSALFQCLEGRDRDSVSRLILTASGGPFWDADEKTLAAITPEQALDHPRWKMGRRVTIDSATLMNKGLELIEAHHLFDQPLTKISVLIHPQAVIHSLVEFVDGQYLAQLGPADMRLPIAYALGYPERLRPSKSPAQDLALTEPLTFFEPDPKKFRCLDLAIRAAEAGHLYTTVLNAADEVAVSAFLKGRIGFVRIAGVVADVLDAFGGRADSGAGGDLDEILAADHWARRRAEQELHRS